MDKVNLRKIAIIGCGFVGSASAFALMQSKMFSEIVLIDADKDKAEGEAMDISHGIPFVGNMKIYAGSYDDIVDASIIVITAGAGQKPGETRLDLVHKNVGIFKSIIPEIAKENAAAYCLWLQTLLIFLHIRLLNFQVLRRTGLSVRVQCLIPQDLNVSSVSICRLTVRVCTHIL